MTVLERAGASVTSARLARAGAEAVHADQLADAVRRAAEKANLTR